MEYGRTTDSLIVKLHDQLSTNDGEAPDLPSFLRVVCLRNLRQSMAASRDVPSIAGLIGPVSTDR
ncbi:MAG TPA: hypothetical protein VNU71_22430 [Burkholderiaceae bacterium]|nr:hypothetical protein [Burkholderiaceae bacterium]